MTMKIFEDSLNAAFKESAERVVDFTYDEIQHIQAFIDYGRTAPDVRSRLAANYIEKLLTSLSILRAGCMGEGHAAGQNSMCFICNSLTAVEPLKPLLECR